MKPLAGLLSFSLIVIVSVAFSVVIPLLILTDWNLEKLFANETQQLTAKIISILGIVFGIFVGVLLWIAVARKRYSDDEIRNFSNRWLKALAVNKIITIALRRRQP